MSFTYGPTDGAFASLASSRRSMAVLVPLLTTLLSLLVCGSAWGTTGHGFAGALGGAGVGDGQFSGNPAPAGVGVGLSGDVFVADQGQSPEGVTFPRLERFGGLGVFGSSIAIDPSAFQTLGTVAVDSAVSGGVYVTAVNPSTGAPSVAKYTLAGTFLYALDASSSGTSISGGSAMAVDSSDGTVYVTATDSLGLPVIDSFDDSGTFITSFDGSNGSSDGRFACPSGLAVDAAHRVYVLDGVGCLSLGRVDQYSSAGVFEARVDDGSRGGPQAVATDPASSEVYVAEAGPSGLQVTHFTAGGATPVQTFNIANVGALSGLAVGPDGAVYAADSTNAVVDRFTAFEGPTVTTAAASDVATTSATLNGTVDPGGLAASYRFEYGLDTSYGHSTAVTGAGSGTGAVPTPYPVTGLNPNTTYHFRIIGFNSSGSIVGEDQTITTVAAPPALDGSPAFASAITSTSARIHATVNPNHSPTTYHIDYGTTTAYGSVAPAPPNVDGDAGSTSIDTPVAAAVTGLAPGTLYHFRITADNGVGGSQHGVDGMFFTAPAAPGTVNSVTTGQATLAATINPHGSPTTYHFNYGPSTLYGASTPEAYGGLGDGEHIVSGHVGGLSPSTTYHVRVVARTDGQTRTGVDWTFTTAPAPVAVAVDAIGVTTSTAILVGTADTHGLPGTYRFELFSLDGGYSATTSEQPARADAGAQRVTAAVAGLPAGESFRLRLVVTSNDATDHSSQIIFATAAVPKVSPPAPIPVGYGCATPRLDAQTGKPKPGDTLTVAGTDLGVGGTVVLGDRLATPTDWSTDGFTIRVPTEATGTLPLTANCGHVSNTIAVAIYRQPDSTFTITKHSVVGSVATLSVRVPGPGKLQTTSSRTKTATIRITKAGTATIKFRLSSAGARTLKKVKRHRLKVTVQIRYTPAGGQPSVKSSALTFTDKAKH
jgi:hypothetical protein